MVRSKLTFCGLGCRPKKMCRCCGESSSSDVAILRSDSGFYSAMSHMDQAPIEASYSFITRIPSSVDITSHPDGSWWSDAHHDGPSITADLGPIPTLHSKLLNVKTSMKHLFDPTDLMDYFPEYRSYPQGRCFVVYQMKLNDVLLTALFQVTDKRAFLAWLGPNPSPADILKNKLKLITCPANMPFKLPLKGPKSADTLSNYFGTEATRFSWHEHPDMSYACLSIDILSVWIIRRTLPTVAFTKGRVCDFIILDYGARAVICGLRVVCTNSALRELTATRP